MRDDIDARALDDLGFIPIEVFGVLDNQWNGGADRVTRPTSGTKTIKHYKGWEIPKKDRNTEPVIFFPPEMDRKRKISVDVIRAGNYFHVLQFRQDNLSLFVVKNDADISTFATEDEALVVWREKEASLLR